VGGGGAEFHVFASPIFFWGGWGVFFGVCFCEVGFCVYFVCCLEVSLGIGGALSLTGGPDSLLF